MCHRSSDAGRSEPARMEATLQPTRTCARQANAKPHPPLTPPLEYHETTPRSTSRLFPRSHSGRGAQFSALSLSHPTPDAAASAKKKNTHPTTLTPTPRSIPRNTHSPRITYPLSRISRKWEALPCLVSHRHPPTNKPRRHSHTSSPTHTSPDITHNSQFLITEPLERLAELC